MIPAAFLLHALYLLELMALYETKFKIMKTMNKFNWAVFLLSCLVFASCKKYLDEKPDKALVVPATLEDCSAILNNYTTMNSSFPVGGEAYADNYYLTDAAWAALASQENKDNYIWKLHSNQHTNQWNPAYESTFYANVVLEALDKIVPDANQKNTWNGLKGSALFFRGSYFFMLAQLYAKSYNSGTATQELGIPLRLSPDIDIKTTRSTLKQTYDRILQDLTESVDLLPGITNNKALPTKTAAYGMLARIYLAIEDYSKAGLYADYCLKRYGELIDYNQLDPTSNAPFKIFNEEVIFQSRVSSNALMSSTRAKVDSNLYLTYQPDDLRKVLFFRPTGNNAYSFKGDYGGNNNLQFNGLATDEQYLIRAECYARTGNKDLALADLNKLLKTRWRTTSTGSTFVNYTASDTNTALEIILLERRKELLFRHLRWTDLRRLNKDPKFAETLKRNLNGQIYELPPNDIRYTLMIPQDIINKTGIEQNQQ